MISLGPHGRFWKQSRSDSVPELSLAASVPTMPAPVACHKLHRSDHFPESLCCPSFD